MATFQELLVLTGSSRLGSTILRCIKEYWGFMHIFCEVELIILCFPQLTWVLLRLNSFSEKPAGSSRMKVLLDALCSHRTLLALRILCYFSWATWKFFVLLTTWPSKCQHTPSSAHITPFVCAAFNLKRHELLAFPRWNEYLSWQELRWLYKVESLILYFRTRRLRGSHVAPSPCRSDFIMLRPNGSS